MNTAADQMPELQIIEVTRAQELSDKLRHANGSHGVMVHFSRPLADAEAAALRQVLRHPRLGGVAGGTPTVSFTGEWVTVAGLSSASTEQDVEELVRTALAL